MSSGLGNTRENSRESVSVFERLLPKSLFGGSRTFFDKSKAPYRRYQNPALGQGQLTVKLNLLIFMVLTGHGCLFFGLCPHIVQMRGSFKMVYID